MKFEEKIKEFKDQRVLLLQGPIGPFFNKFARKLRSLNAEVFKLNFNGGDKIFYPFKAHAYLGKLQAFRHFIKHFFTEHKINTLIVYNDCRPLHRIAIKVARRMNVKIYVFEEGYLRPNFITLEKDGVNANSKIPRDKEFYLGYLSKCSNQKNKSIKGAFKIMAFYAFLYWLFAFLMGWHYNNRLHHRTLNPLEVFPWIRSLYRKIIYHFSEKKLCEDILENKKKYFVAVLQVFNDTQILTHYKNKSIEKFIEDTLISFAKNARDKHFLVFKHHPMDRGYKNYSHLIKNLCERYQLQNRVFYVHDIHLPTLLNGALGCVSINSTVGISALYHNCPLKVCGEAFYDITGLTYQGKLDFFWKESHANRPSNQLYVNFKNYLLDTNQINGNYYKSCFLNNFK
ncbi:capsule biosynthesis protein [Campylobacter sp. MIT 99-7217]|uniref:capsule polysaccharide modification protein KpsS n=1 Tax=Campylobacter sp. MIT 99-7217 TaxID=535091 RepID=UPI00115839AE|nr:capsular biosynthesis protein [Campylobacter sp. MIT 99-7217]TQR34418.1 capsule biosynthesis protein [Campylobacter sp. MIT 99-7217]